MIALSGCSSATSPAQHRGFWPSQQRWREAAVGALRSPDTWVPAAGAAVVGIGGWDEDVSEWAVRETPIFGSPGAASDASNVLFRAAHLGMVATALAVQSDEAPWKSRIERLLWEHVGAIAATGVTGPLKEATGRDRPNGSDYLSFPSAHSSGAFAYSSIGVRNLRAIDLPRPARKAFSLSLTTLAAGTAWARVEGGAHYPSDVLAGAALGTFIGQLVHDAFLGAEDDLGVSVRFDRHSHAITVTLRF